MGILFHAGSLNGKLKVQTLNDGILIMKQFQQFKPKSTYNFEQNKDM